MPPRLIYFDLGKVLLSFSHESMCRQIADVAGVSPGQIREVLFGNGDLAAVQWRYEIGQIDTDEYYDYFCRRIGRRPDRPSLEHAACNIFEPIVANWELVQMLVAAGHRCAILSNVNALHWEFITNGRFPLLESPGSAGSPFAWAVTSHEVGSMKPDRRIYEIAIQRAGLRPGSIFFVDDRPENVAAARTAGMDAVLYEGTSKLVEDLQRRGLDGIQVATQHC